MSCAERLSSVDEHGDAVLRGDRKDLVVVGRTAEEIDRDDRGDLSAGAGARVEDGQQHLRIESPGFRLDVDEDGLGAGVGHGERGRTEGEGRNDHVVAGLDAQPHQAQVDSGRARGQRQGVCGPRVVPDVSLEAVHLRTERGNPPGRDGTRQRLDLEVGHMRLRQQHRAI